MLATGSNSLQFIFMIPAVGARVEVPGGAAVLRYVGSIAGREGVFCGLELLGELRGRGKNSGEVSGRRYFDVEVAGSGLFVPLRKVEGWLQVQSAEAVTENAAAESQRTVIHNGASLASSVVSGNSRTAVGPPVGAQSDMTQVVTTTYGSGGPPTSEVYHARLLKSEHDLSEISAQLDEVEANLRRQEDIWREREARFAQYKREKDLEVEQLVETVRLLSESNSNASNERVTQLEMQLRERDETIAQLKAELGASQQISQPVAVESSAKPSNLLNPDGTLKVFTPSVAAPKSPNFCDFCDRHGHTRVECPYENDYDQF